MQAVSLHFTNPRTSPWGFTPATTAGFTPDDFPPQVCVLWTQSKVAKSNERENVSSAAERSSPPCIQPVTEGSSPLAWSQMPGRQTEPFGQGDGVQQHLLMSDLAMGIQCPGTEVHPSCTRSPLSEMAVISQRPCETCHAQCSGESHC